jgi:hypothetical protein
MRPANFGIPDLLDQVRRDLIEVGDPVRLKLPRPPVGATLIVFPRTLVFVLIQPTLYRLVPSAAHLVFYDAVPPRFGSLSVIKLPSRAEILRLARPPVRCTVDLEAVMPNLASQIQIL